MQDTGVAKGKKVWSVPLAPNHRPYQTCLLERGVPNAPTWTVVVVDARKLMLCYDRSRDDLMVGLVSTWDEGDVSAIRRFLDPRVDARTMPQVNFEERRGVGLLRPRVLGVASILEGRHRARYLAFAGARYFPVEVLVRQADALRRHCGYQGPENDRRLPGKDERLADKQDYSRGR